MKPIDQDIFVDDPQGRVGNCLQAAVASILERRLNEVPHFAATDDWFGSLCNWLNENGYRLHDLDPEEIELYDEDYLVFGKSPRKGTHAVVYNRDKLSHDPHPSRAGVLNVIWCGSIIKSQ